MESQLETFLFEQALLYRKSMMTMASLEHFVEAGVYANKYDAVFFLIKKCGLVEEFAHYQNNFWDPPKRDKNVKKEK